MWSCLQNRLNITKTVRKYSIDKHLNPTGSEFQSGPVSDAIRHDEEVDEEHGEGSVSLYGRNFDRIANLWVNCTWILYLVIFCYSTCDFPNFVSHVTSSGIQFWLWIFLLLGAIGVTAWYCSYLCCYIAWLALSW